MENDSGTIPTNSTFVLLYGKAKNISLSGYNLLQVLTAGAKSVSPVIKIMVSASLDWQSSKSFAAIATSVSFSSCAIWKPYHVFPFAHQLRNDKD